jgi:hypothetical protein
MYTVEEISPQQANNCLKKTCTLNHLVSVYKIVFSVYIPNSLQLFHSLHVVHHLLPRDDEEPPHQPE